MDTENDWEKSLNDVVDSHKATVLVMQFLCISYLKYSIDMYTLVVSMSEDLTAMNTVCSHLEYTTRTCTPSCKFLCVVKFTTNSQSTSFGSKEGASKTSTGSTVNIRCSLNMKYKVHL
jgi:hypothetical protein